VDDQGFSIPQKLPKLQVIKAAGTRIVHPRVICKFAESLEVLDLAGTRVSRLSDAQHLMKTARWLRSLDLRDCPLTRDLYPDIAGQTLGSRAEFGSLRDYNDMYPDTAAARSQYRNSLLGCAASSLDILDGIFVRNEEAELQPQRAPVSERPRKEQKEVEMQTVNFSSETDGLVRKLTQQNKRLKQEKEMLVQRERLLQEIDEALAEQDRLRAERNLPTVARKDFTKLKVDELKRLRRTVRKQNAEIAQHSSTDSSEKLSRLIEEKRSLREQVGSLKKPTSPPRQPPRARSRTVDTDRDKTAMIGQLMAENALLRDQLGLEPLQYMDTESVPSDQFDTLIRQLLDHNQMLRDEALKLPKGPFDSPRTKMKERFELFHDLMGNRDGCTFWVPLTAEQQQHDQEYLNRPLKQLPISVSKKPKSRGCKKCEKALLMMARVPPFPADSSKITEHSDEFHLVETWLATSLNTRIALTALAKSGFYWKFIENERTMKNIHLVVMETPNAVGLIAHGIQNPIVVADHCRYVLRELKARGAASVLIAAFDDGNQATNFCEHTTIPDVNEMRIHNQSCDSLRFRYQGDEAILTINRSRVVPLYAAQITLDAM
jgi:uncharacterized protein YpiB (UPF0302 family)